MFQPVHLTVVPEAAQVELGGQLILSLTIRNAGSSRATRFRIDVSGIPRDWYDLDQTRASLAPSSHERVHLTVHPTAGAATLAGSYAITVHVTAEDDPTNHHRAGRGRIVYDENGCRHDLRPLSVMRLC